MNESRHHTDQADSRETFAAVEAKLRAVGYQPPTGIQLTPQEAGARAAKVIAERRGAANQGRACDDCPCDGMGGLTAAFLLCVGTVTGVVLTLIAKG